jgi:hypothetical protein
VWAHVSRLIAADAGLLREVVGLGGESLSEQVLKLLGLLWVFGDEMSHDTCEDLYCFGGEERP